MERGEIERTGHSRIGIFSLGLGVVALVLLAPLLSSSTLEGVNPRDLEPQKLNRDSPVVVVATVVGSGSLVGVPPTLVGLRLAGLVTGAA